MIKMMTESSKVGNYTKKTQNNKEMKREECLSVHEHANVLNVRSRLVQGRKRGDLHKIFKDV